MKHIKRSVFTGHNFIATKRGGMKRRGYAWTSFLRKREAKYEALDPLIDYLSKQAKAAEDALFLLNGYHEHTRQWRKTDLKTTTKQPSISELVKLTDKEKPAPEHLQMLRQHMDENNELVKLNEIGEGRLKA